MCVSWLSYAESMGQGPEDGAPLEHLVQVVCLVADHVLDGEVDVVVREGGMASFALPLGRLEAPEARKEFCAALPEGLEAERSGSRGERSKPLVLVGIVGNDRRPLR